MRALVAFTCVMLAVVGCQPEPTVPDLVHRRVERRAARLAIELDQASAVQRDLERTLIIAGCAVAVLAAALIRKRKGG